MGTDGSVPTDSIGSFIVAQCPMASISVARRDVSMQTLRPLQVLDERIKDDFSAFCGDACAV